MTVKQLIERLKDFPPDLEVAYFKEGMNWDTISKVELIEDAVFTSSFVDDEERKKMGKDTGSFVGLSY